METPGYPDRTPEEDCTSSNENVAFDPSFKRKVNAMRSIQALNSIQKNNAGLGYKLSTLNLKRSRLKKISLVDSEQDIIAKINELIAQQKQKEEIIKQLEEENVPQQLGDRWQLVLNWCENNAA